MAQAQIPETTQSTGLTNTQRRFLLVFRNIGSVIQSARACKIRRENHYAWMRESPAYRVAFAEAEVESVTVLEDEAYRRGVIGVDEPVFHRGRVCGIVRKYDTTLLCRLMSARNPAKHRDRSSVELTGKDGQTLIPLAAVDAIIQQGDDEDTDEG